MVVGVFWQIFVILGGSLWFLVVLNGFWWFFGGSWWFLVVLGGSWWFLMVVGVF